MPISKNALIRYKTIDGCLKNRFRNWTLSDLIEACSDALSEYEGRDENISKRTIQADIQMMRSEKLGYNAPIIVVDKKYYTYEDPEYSITQTPLSEQDIETMTEAVGVLKQMSGFSALSGMEDIVGKLEDHLGVLRSERKGVIYFEKNDDLTGLHYITPVYDAILAQKPLKITYHSFKKAKAETFEFSPYVLKEFRNRWYIFGRRTGNDIVFNLALDRIKSLEDASNEAKYVPIGTFDPETYFENMIGVTKNMNSRAQRVRIKVSARQVPYIRTKPLHKSQMTTEIDQDGNGIFSLNVVVNYEFEKELLSYGEGLEVLEPLSLRKTIQRRLEAALDKYKKRN